jgi:thymidylate synthase
MKKFKNAQDAFEYYYYNIIKNGYILEDTKCLYNEGFEILNPLDNKINTKFRKWNESYAMIEWDWYMSQNRSVEEIKKIAKTWDKMHNGNNIVNSNYGYQWNRNGQLDYVINELKRNSNSRRAILTIYDGKEHIDYKFDTPCTLNISFNIFNNKLNMSVLMRSNDLWYGFCNDQYCFSNLQKYISDKLNLDIGTYFHFSNNLHIYNKHFKKLNTL